MIATCQDWACPARERCQRHPASGALLPLHPLEWSYRHTPTMLSCHAFQPTPDAPARLRA